MASPFIIGLLAMAPGQGCPPAAVIVGEPELVETVRGELERRGVGAPDGLLCPSIEVKLSRNGDRLAMLIDRPGEQTIVRSAAHPARAATIIESWVRDDLTDPLMIARRLLPRIAAPKPAPEAEPAPVTTAAPPIATNTRSFAVGMGAVIGQASDGSTWTGIDLRGCFQVGVVCLGGRAQYAVDTEIAGEAKTLGGDRSFIDVGLTADLPVVVGAFELAPGIGLGQAILQSEVRIDGKSVEDDTGGVRLRAQLGAAWRITERVSARIETAIDYAPFAHTELFESATEDGPETIRLPSEPRLMGWIRLGVELGGI